MDEISIYVEINILFIGVQLGRDAPHTHQSCRAVGAPQTTDMATHLMVQGSPHASSGQKFCSGISIFSCKKSKFCKKEQTIAKIKNMLSPYQIMLRIIIYQS
jgi:hypothetical protein